MAVLGIWDHCIGHYGAPAAFAPRLRMAQSEALRRKSDEMGTHLKEVLLNAPSQGPMLHWLQAVHHAMQTLTEIGRLLRS